MVKKCRPPNEGRARGRRCRGEKKRLANQKINPRRTGAEDPGTGVLGRSGKK